MPQTKRGLYEKYRIEKIDDPNGKHKECNFFVMDLTHDETARKAMRVYILFMWDINYQLAKDLDDLLKSLEGK